VPDKFLRYFFRHRSSAVVCRTCSYHIRQARRHVFRNDDHHYIHSIPSTYAFYIKLLSRFHILKHLQGFRAYPTRPSDKNVKFIPNILFVFFFLVRYIGTYCSFDLCTGAAILYRVVQIPSYVIVVGIILYLRKPL